MYNLAIIIIIMTQQMIVSSCIILNCKNLLQLSSTIKMGFTYGDLCVIKGIGGSFVLMDGENFLKFLVCNVF